MPNRSKGRGRTKRLPGSPGWGLGCGPALVKNTLLPKPEENEALCATRHKQAR